MIIIRVSLAIVLLLGAWSNHAMGSDSLSKRDFLQERSQLIQILLEVDRDKSQKFDHLFPREGKFSFLTFFIQSLQADGADLCFFGGWPSEKRGGLCLSPWKVPTQERFGLGYDKDHYCGHPDMFRCHPILFGPGSGRLSQEYNGKSLEAGICVNYKEDGGSIRDVTSLCSEASSELNNEEALYEKYKSDEDYREKYELMKEEILLFCESHPQYSACSLLRAKINQLERVFQCEQTPLNLVMPMNLVQLNGLELLHEKSSELAPTRSRRPRARPNRADRNREVSESPVAEERGSCEESFGSKSVLYIGDSHSYLRSREGNRMGNRVANRVKECGASEFHYRGVCGSRPLNWSGDRRPRSTCGVSEMGPQHFNTQNSGQTDNLDTLIRDTNAEVVMINLGDNMFNWRSRNGVREAYVSSQPSLVNEVRGLLQSLSVEQKCIWIGPTYHSRGSSYYKPNSAVDELYSILSTAINGRCRLMDSRDYFEETSPNDGLHLVPSESRRWGDSIARDL